MSRAALASETVIIVGAGLAGVSACDALRRHGFAGRIIIFGAEGVAPYDRPPLSKKLFSQVEPVALADSLGFDVWTLAQEVYLDDPVINLEVFAEFVQVTTSSSRVVRADFLIIAVGSQAVVPAQWDGVTSLHSTAHAAAIRKVCSPGDSLAIIGAGWIGSEVAHSALTYGVTVSVFEAAEGPLWHQVGPAISSILRTWFLRSGVRLVSSAQVTAASARQVSFRLKTAGDPIVETVTSSCVLAAIGTRPAVGTFVPASILRSERGALLVEQGGEVNGLDGPVNHIFAVGDCADRRDNLWGTVPGSHWSAALADPDAIARTIMNQPQVNRPAPYVFSEHSGHNIALFGQPNSQQDHVIFRGDPLGHEGWIAFYIHRDSGLATGAFLCDFPRAMGPIRRLFAQGPWRINTTLAMDPAVPLSLLVR